jgi:hypothetical protein
VASEAPHCVASRATINPNLHLEFTMKKRFLSAVLVALSTSFAIAAFASGYGPAPFYRPSIGAPASQRGQSGQTVVAERNQAGMQASEAYGGVAAQTTQSSRLSLAQRHGAE